MSHQAAKSIKRAIDTEDWVGARKLIRDRLKSESGDHWLLTRLALTYYEQRQYRRALAYEIKALQAAPYCPLAIWGYAGTLDMVGRQGEALALYRWLVSWGEDLLAYGECGEGMRAARSLIADCHYRIARIWEDKRQRKRALTAYAEYLSKRELGAGSIYSIHDVKRRCEDLMDSQTKSLRG